MNSVHLCQIMAILSVLLVFASFLMTWGKLSVIIRSTNNYSGMAVQEDTQFNNNSNLSVLNFYSSYHVKGFLRLPHSNLNEPIEVWYNKEHKKSRIDYYDGEVKTYQDGNIGLSVKITPKYNSVTNTHSIGCWKKIKPGKISAQSIIPTKWSWPFEATLGSFKYVGDDYIRGKLCTKWKFTHKVYEKNNVYTFWVEKTYPPVPVRYEMSGYDTLLTSYYDKYIIDYTLYGKWYYDDEILNIPQIRPGDTWCWNVSDVKHQGDGGEFDMNPMGKFLSQNGEEDSMELEFHRYKKKHGKVYDMDEHSRRNHLFRHNARFIHSVNRQNRNFRLKLNHFADMTDAEYNLHKGAAPDHDLHAEVKRQKRSSRKPIHEHYKPGKNSPSIPDELDWREFGAVSLPRGQGTCGSCWAFAAIGALEGANFIKTGKLVELSEQQMMDCTWKVRGLRQNKGNSGCHGGWAWKAFYWGRSNTIATRESYGPYKGQEGYCKTENLTVGAKIYGFRRVKRWSPTALRRAVAYHGPAAVSINSHPLTLKFYSGGILDDRNCNNKTEHAVLVVGYGRENGTNYWLVKNSWSTMWGDKGYIKIKEDCCGVIKKPVVVYDKHLKNYPWKKKWRRHKRKWHRINKSQHKRSRKISRDNLKHGHRKQSKHKQRNISDKIYKLPSSITKNIRGMHTNSWKGKWLSLGK